MRKDIVHGTRGELNLDYKLFSMGSIGEWKRGLEEGRGGRKCK